MGIQQMLLGSDAGELIVIVSATSTNLNASTLFGSNYSASIPKRLRINSGVTVGSTAVGTPALQIPTGLAGGLIIENFGSIQGAGGAAGTGGAGGTGGDAILAQTACRVINNSGATIYSGGGGGGRGGNGGTGGGGQFATVTDIGAGYTGGGTDCNQSCYNRFGANATITCKAGTCSIQYTRGGAIVSCGMCVQSGTALTNGGAGGAGGSGGRGQGYNAALAGGSSGAGGSAGGTNAGAGGTGGTGGSGGNWGLSGANGNTGNTGANGNRTAGSAGAGGSGSGLAGFYINGLSSFVILTNNGTVAGRTN